ncbi:hypothetical protein BGZ68_006335 [Mortierella alpina]|nr:hypothetical protein BGZ68_006335 [Mortierella alpina]
MLYITLVCTLLGLISSTSAQPHPVGGAAYVSFHDRLYVQGGDLGGGNLINQFYALDLSRSWQTVSPVWNTLPAGPINAYHSGGFSADMNSFVTFGRETGSPYTTANFINIFSTSTGSWIGTGSTMIADPTRRDMTIASDPSPGGQIYFMGGDAGQAGTGRSNVIDIYNLKSSVVSETVVPPPGPQNLQGGAAAWLPHRKSMMIVGGMNDNLEGNSVYLFTPESDQSQSSTSGSYMTSSSSNSNIDNNGPYSSSSNSNSNGNYNSYSNSNSNSNNPNVLGSNSNSARSDEDGSVVAVFGGFVNQSSTSDHSIYFLDTRTWIWTSSTSNSVRGRSYSACAFSGNQFIVWGGFYQNPTSIPNNLPSIEESTLVYSLAAQNWVKTFEPSAGASSGSASGGQGERTNGNELSNGTKNIGIILAIAAVGAILALLITIGALMVIRKRNQRRRGSSSSASSGGGLSASRRNSSQLANHLGSSGPVSASNMMAPALNKTHFGTWDHHPRSGNLESGLVKDDKAGWVDNDINIPAVTGYNPWGRRESTTTVNTIPGITQTQTMIVATPIASSKRN